jgi:hypothetical protein
VFEGESLLQFEAVQAGERNVKDKAARDKAPWVVEEFLR